MKYQIFAPAKINLYLDVLNKRKDNYHNIESVMQTISLFDRISLDIYDTGSNDNIIEILCSDLSVATDNTNLIYKVADLFLKKINAVGKKCIFSVDKNIPIAAGLAGGSTDAAGTLKLLNEAFSYPLSLNQLCEIGVVCGADIPFCITGGTCVCTGIGENITPIRNLTGVLLVCAIDSSSVSTPHAFALLDQEYDTDAVSVNGIDRITDCIESGNINSLCTTLYNIFESVIIPRNENVNKIKNTLLSCGACGALMSGSGPSVFGIFSSEKEQKKAYRTLVKEGIRAFVCKTL